MPLDDMYFNRGGNSTSFWEGPGFFPLFVAAIGGLCLVFWALSL